MRILFFISIWMLAEVIFYRIIKDVFKKSKNKKLIFKFHWICVFLITIIFLSIFFYPPHKWNHLFRIIIAVAMMLWFCKLLTAFIYIPLKIPELLFKFLRTHLIRRNSVPANTSKNIPSISRRAFLEKTALASGAFMFGGFSFGVIEGAYHYKIHRVRFRFPTLPSAFNGMRIVQISDLHVGSFSGPEPLCKVRDIISNLSPDLLLFTGDLVNNVSHEVSGFEKALSSFEAPMGIYSVLGNHDYGDYVQWPSEEDKIKNFENLLNVQRNLGWNLLKNQHVILERGSGKIALIGVENWSSHLRFPKYGKLHEAYNGTEQIPFRILMSHDPSHWKSEVLKHYPEIHLTLSGHTHGFQFGVEIPGLKWSPVQYVYPQWAGAYQEGNQFLYVNRGLGFIGYPGRLGIWPEITLIELTT